MLIPERHRNTTTTAAASCIPRCQCPAGRVSQGRIGAALCGEAGDAHAAQVVVVVTHGWHVLCFDHNLKLLWDRSIRVRGTAMPKPACAAQVAKDALPLRDAGSALGTRLRTEIW